MQGPVDIDAVGGWLHRRRDRRGPPDATAAHLSPQLRPCAFAETEARPRDVAGDDPPAPAKAAVALQEATASLGREDLGLLDEQMEAGIAAAVYDQPLDEASGDEAGESGDEGMGHAYSSIFRGEVRGGDEAKRSFGVARHRQPVPASPPITASSAA